MTLNFTSRNLIIALTVGLVLLLFTLIHVSTDNQTHNTFAPLKTLSGPSPIAKKERASTSSSSANAIYAQHLADRSTLLHFPNKTNSEVVYEDSILLPEVHLPPSWAAIGGRCVYPRELHVRYHIQRRPAARLTLVTYCKSSSRHSYDAALRALSIQNKRSYAARHGYHWVDASDSPVSQPELQLHWQKAIVMRQLLYTSNWLLWMDCDSLIINQSVPLHQHLDEHYEMIASRDHNALNTGVFFLRSSAFAQHLLEATICLAPSIDAGPSRSWAEQAAIIDLLRLDITSNERVKYVPQHAINSYVFKPVGKGKWKPGDIVGHAVNCHQPECYERFIKLAQTVEHYWNLLPQEQIVLQKDFHSAVLDIISRVWYGGRWYGDEGYSKYN